MSSSQTTSNPQFTLQEDRSIVNGSASDWNPIKNSYLYTDTLNKAGPLPNWRYLISNGLNATTGMSGLITTLEKEDGNAYFSISPRPPFTGNEIRYESKGDMCRFTLPLLGSLISGVNYNTVRNQALAKYYAHVASVEAVFKGLTFSGELRESLAMMRSPAKALRRGVDDYLSFLRKKGRKLPRGRRPSFVRETWLEYAFGWKPLISDLDAAVTAFYSSDSVRPIFQMVYGKATNNYVEMQGPNFPTNGPLTWYYTLRKHEEVMIRFYGIYRSTGNGSPNSHVYGFNPSEFLPTVWELIPYSFLVDYFTNIGDIVSSWSYRFLASSFTSELQRSTHTYESVDVGVSVAPDDTNTTLYDSGGTPGSIRWKHVGFVRTPDVGTPIPGLELEVPGMRSLKWVNILALSKNLGATRKVMAR